MSITVFIHNDEDKSDAMDYDCTCTMNPTEKANPSCKNCNGKGIIFYKTSKYRVDFNNRNFNTVWNCLGIDPALNTILPIKLLKALNSFNPELAVRKNEFSNGISESDNAYNFIDPVTNGPKTVNMGYSLQTIQMRKKQLIELCMQALKMEEMVRWG